MRPRAIPAIFILLIVFIGCNTNPTGSLLSRKFPLEVGQSLAVDNGGVTIGFDTVLYDSRCPSDALIYCSTAGLASIRLWAKKAGSDTAYVNVSIPGFTDTNSANHYPWATVYDLKIRLRQLDPYPDTGVSDPHEYKAWLAVQDYYSVDGDAVIITDENPLGLMVDPFDVDNFYVNNQFQATITVSYGGGCAEHDLYLFMSPAEFETTDPPKANLYVQHLGYGDACEALITREATFDLRPLVSLFQIQNDGGDGPILLTVYQYDGIDLFAADTTTITVGPPPLE